MGTPQNEREQGRTSPTSRPVSKGGGNTPADTSDVEKGADINHAEDTTDGPRRKVPEGYKEFDDPNIVNWDGPDDPSNPYNWKVSKKIILAASIAAITFITYVVIPGGISFDRILMTSF